MIKNIKKVSAISLLFIIFIGCEQYKTELPQGNISEYLPITLNDYFSLTTGWYYPRKKTSFSNSELLIIYNVINSFEPYGGIPSWVNNPKKQIYGQSTRLYVFNDSHEINIYFTAHDLLGFFTLIIVNEYTLGWFTMNGDTFSELFDLLLTRDS